ncbi:aldo/keto reductase [Azonexus sp.]|jgi:aryl-alcohol dehydrogenase-like predicted oxidoreductase|uniref:aldo/keto reductase n=1 Tax=Azonexus sp. TaxID=1872668 RepID=UPI0028227721|nr:aldo/keto reductase [Azonexus sp.]MDR1994728.1 aldo/keto reductase [Azonexus sp.]
MKRLPSLRRRQLLAVGLALGASTLLPAAQEQMPQLLRTVPSTGTRLPVIGLGTNRFRLGDEAWLERLRETLSTFVRYGGEVVDTAPSYGDSEQAIGSLLAATGLRQQIFLATKVDRDTADAGRERLAASHIALRSQHLDLVQLHNLQGVDTVLPVLREQQAAGLIRHVGITSSTSRQYAEMEAIMRRERLDFIQVDYAVGNRGAAERLLPLAADRGMAVLVNLPFGRGAQFRAVGTRPLPPWAAEIDCHSWAQVFLKYVVSHPAVTCAIPGSTQAAHVADNLGAGRGRLPDEAERQTIARYFDAIAD